MPVTPQYSWTQNAETVDVCVHLPSTTRRKSEVFGTTALIKVVAHPYFLQLDLAEDVDYSRAVATLKGSVVRFVLPKVCDHLSHASLPPSPAPCTLHAHVRCVARM